MGNPQLTALLRASGSSSGYSQAFRKMSGYAFNEKDDNYFSGQYSLMNLVTGNGVEGFDSPGSYQDALGWLRGVPAGSLSFTRRIVFGMSPGTGYFPPGTYRVTTQGGMYCTVSSGGSFFHVVQQGIDSPTQSLRDAIFTIDDLGASGIYSDTFLSATVHARSAGGPFDCADLYLGKDSNYAAWLAGAAICDPLWLADHAGGAAYKNADQVGMNTAVNYTTRADQLISPLRSYQGTSSSSYGTMAQKCKELGCINWIIAPYGYESGAFSCSSSAGTVTATAIAGMPFVSTWPVGQQVAVWGGGFQDGADHFGLFCLTIYYVKSVVSSGTNTATYTLSLTPDGAAVPITADFAGNDYGYQIASLDDPYPMFLAIMQQTYAANPSGLLAPQTGLENWNSAYYYERHRLLGSLQAGFPGDAGKSYAWRTLRLWKAIEKVYPRSQYLRLLDSWSLGSYGFNTIGSALDYVSTDPAFYPGKSLSQLMEVMSTAAYPHQVNPANGSNWNPFDIIANYGTNPTVSQWSLITRAGIDGYATQAAQWRAALDAKRPNTPCIMYEGGLQEGMALSGGPSSTVTAVTTGSPGSLTATWPYGTDPWPANYAVAVPSTGTGPGGLTAQPYYYVHASSTNTSLVLSATQGGAALPITSAGSGTITASLCGQQVIDIGTSFEAYLASTEYAADLLYYLQTVVRDGLKARSLALYCTTGGWGKSTNGLGYWGIKRASQLPDTPGMTTFKTFNDYVALP